MTFEVYSWFLRTHIFNIEDEQRSPTFVEFCFCVIHVHWAHHGMAAKWYKWKQAFMYLSLLSFSCCVFCFFFFHFGWNLTNCKVQMYRIHYESIFFLLNNPLAFNSVAQIQCCCVFFFFYLTMYMPIQLWYGNG